MSESKFIRQKGEIKNKGGKVIDRYIKFMPKKGTVNIDQVSKIYKKLKLTQDPQKLMIKIETNTQYLTAKSYGETGDDLDLFVDQYYSSLSKEGIDKFKNLLSFTIYTR